MGQFGSNLVNEISWMHISLSQNEFQMDQIFKYKSEMKKKTRSNIEELVYTHTHRV